MLLVPSLQRVRDPRRLSVRHTVRNYDHAGMGRARLEEGNGELDVVVTISGDEDATGSSSELELREVLETSALDLVNGVDVKSQAAADLRHGWMHVLVEQKPQTRSSLPLQRCSEGQLFADALRCPRILSVQSSVDFLRVNSSEMIYWSVA